MEAVWSTHATEADAGVVVKRFQPGHHDGARREWSGLSLLRQHAPGLAPRPLRKDLSSNVAEIAMEKLNGQPLRGLKLSNIHLQALASAVGTLMHAPPPAVLGDLDLARSRPEHVLPRLHEPLDPDIDLPEAVRSAVRASQEWATHTPLVDTSQDHQTVFGHGDSNLANYLYDGDRVQIVDFEDSGRSDRACELAEIVEHIAFWHEAGRNPTSLTSMFDLSGADQSRLLECRRMHASAWLRILINAQLSGRCRNQPGTLESLAERLLNLLG